MEITLRPMREEDLEQVLEIESASFSRPWTKRHFLDELESPFGHPFVAFVSDGTLAGYLCLKQLLDEAEILDVAVAAAMRGRGVGGRLVREAITLARERGAVVLSLEVREGNDAAISLYRRLGFHEVGRRKRYYDNGEDAVLMDIHISEAGECDAV